MNVSPTSRFTDRVDHYVRHRPSYPAAVLDILRREAGLAPPARVADIGSGTGISSALFLDAGFEVVAVEPNRAMREAAEASLGRRPGFRSVDGRAEATTLPAAHVDAVVAGQAFHWFDADAARREFARILGPPGRVVLLWNTRRTDTSAFLRAYEALLLEFAPDYREVDHRRVDEDALRGFFGGGHYARHVLPNHQLLDREGLAGRLLSSSYTPAEGHPRHVPMFEALDRMFDAHQQDGIVRMDYDTEVHIGVISGPGKAE